MKQTKQKKRLFLLPQQDRAEERSLADAFVGMVRALPRRPEPRWLWDNVASRGRAAPKGTDAVKAGKIVIDAAIMTGDMAVIDSAAGDVGHYYDVMKGQALTPYYALVNGDISIDAARMKASKETHEALHHIVTSMVHGNDGCPLTIKEIDEAIHALSDLRAQMTVVLNQPRNHRAALALS